MKIYYGLTKDEIKQDYLIYDKIGEYEYKGVNTSLDGLKKFIKDNKMEKLITHYVILDLKDFQVADEVLFDEEYDMMAIRLPFKFKICNVKKL